MNDRRLFLKSLGMAVLAPLVGGAALATPLAAAAATHRGAGDRARPAACSSSTAGSSPRPTWTPSASMRFDTATPEREAFARTFDVCVIGSGPAGITLARRLAARGLDVALMEGGDLYWSEESRTSTSARTPGWPTTTSTWRGCATSAAPPGTGTAPAPISTPRASSRTRSTAPATAGRSPRPTSTPTRRKRPTSSTWARRVPEVLDAARADRRPAGDPVAPQRADPVRREIPRRDHRLRPDLARAQRQPRRPPARFGPRPGDPGGVPLLRARRTRASPSRRRSSRSAPAASRTRGCCSTSTARCPAASATRHDQVGRYFCDHPARLPRRGAVRGATPGCR